MADRVLRGSRLGAVSYETDRNHDLAPRQSMRYACPRGHDFEVPFANDAEAPATWECRLHGSISKLVDGAEPEQKKAKPPRTHWDMLLERRSVAELEVLLNERLELLRRAPRRDRLTRAATDESRVALGWPGSVVSGTHGPGAQARTGPSGPHRPVASRPSTRAAPQRVTRHSASATIAPLIFDAPRSRSVKVIGTSRTRNPACTARQAMSIWKQ